MRGRTGGRRAPNVGDGAHHTTRRRTIPTQAGSAEGRRGRETRKETGLTVDQRFSHNAASRRQKASLWYVFARASGRAPHA